MKITRKSPLRGKQNTLDIPITNTQLKRWKAGALIQYVAPELSADEREFLMSGLTREDWEEIFAIQADGQDTMNESLARNPTTISESMF